MKILFLDESGDHNLRIIDPQYPLFVLGGVVLDKDYAENELPKKLSSFKKELFGSDDIILHTADITRNRNGFENLKDPNFRIHFYEKLNYLMRELRYSVVACVIKKDKHLSRYGVAALDPYLLSLDILVERFCMMLGNTKHSGQIVAERRDPTLDHELELAWLNLKIQGTRFLQAKQIEHRILRLNLIEKTANIAGLQLADLIATPIGRHVLGKQEKKDYRIVESKLHRSPSGRIEGYGLVVLPK